MLDASTVATARGGNHNSKAVRRWDAVLLRVLLLALPCLVILAAKASACGSVCVPPHNENIPFSSFSGQSGAGQSFRLAGFGVALADHDVANCQPGENPGFASANLVWKDFRFYAKIPGLPGSGIVKATLNREKSSAVLLTANDFSGNGGLFPASLTNKIFLRLLPVDFPGVEYRNAAPVTIYTPNTWSAPPDSTVITRQQGEAVFELVGTPLPGMPQTITFSGGEQRFLDPVGIELHLLSANAGSVDVQLSNPLPQNVQVAYFLHLDDQEPLGEMVEPLDGVKSVAAGGHANLSFNLQGIPVGQKTIVVDAMVLDPIGVAGHDRLKFQLPVSTGPSGASALKKSGR
jgi:hypothetical protein